MSNIGFYLAKMTGENRTGQCKHTKCSGHGSYLMQALPSFEFLLVVDLQHNKTNIFGPTSRETKVAWFEKCKAMKIAQIRK